MCKVCGNDKCLGKYILHPEELKEIPKLKEKELREDANRTFVLVDSPSIGDIFLKFKELHVIGS